MIKILTGQLRTVPGVYYAVSQMSRVISLAAFYKGVGTGAFAVSEAISNPFRVLSVHAWVLWASYTGTPSGTVRFTVGVGKEVNAVVVAAWEPILPLRTEGGDYAWEVSLERDEYCWTMRKPYAGQGRRLGVMFGVGDGVAIATLFVSYQIEEG